MPISMGTAKDRAWAPLSGVWGCAMLWEVVGEVSTIFSLRP